MTEYLVRSRFDRMRMHHVRLAFSDSMSSLGRVKVGKVWRLFVVMLKLLRFRFRKDIDLVVFSPAGPKLVPVMRDVVLLLFVRALFRRIAFHFHAAGVSEFLKSAPAWARYLAFAAYRRPLAAIQTSQLNPADGEYLGAVHTTVIPNGIPDEAKEYLRRLALHEGPIRILFVGIVAETKGIMVLLEAARLLAMRHRDFTVWIVGEFGSAEFEHRAQRFCEAHDLQDTVLFLGQKVGAEKWGLFHEADILCFPSFFESESFGLAALEGMMFSLPVVATRWRGIPDVVEDGQTGFLVPVRDSVALASRLDTLIANGDLRREMGAKGRARYLSRFSIEEHLSRMEDFLYTVACTEPTAGSVDRDQLAGR